jgi:hypothetical protein
MDNEGCAGCIQQAILNRTQKTITEQNAKKYSEEKKITTVVYFDGQQYTFAEETAGPFQNVTGIFSPTNQPAIR